MLVCAGVLCVGMRGSDCERLQLPQMVQSSENEEEMSTAFTVTVDLRGGGVTTGISAADRSATIRALGDVATVAADLRKPGHVFPLRAREGGVLVRPGHTEAAVDLAYFSGALLAPFVWVCFFVFVFCAFVVSLVALHPVHSVEALKTNAGNRTFHMRTAR